MNQCVESNQILDLARIYDENVGLCLWNPAPCKARLAFSKELAGKEFNCKSIVSADVPHLHLDILPENEGYESFREWVAELVDIFATLFGLSQVGLRISSANRPMCPR